MIHSYWHEKTKYKRTNTVYYPPLKGVTWFSFVDNVLTAWGTGGNKEWQVKDFDEAKTLARQHSVYVHNKMISQQIRELQKEIQDLEQGIIK
jgi:hypothetical protein